MNLDRSQNLTVADPDLQIRGGRGRPAHSDPEIGWVEEGAVSIWLVWFLRVEGGGGGVRAGSFPPPPESATA